MCKSFADNNLNKIAMMKIFFEREKKGKLKKKNVGKKI